MADYVALTGHDELRRALQTLPDRLSASAVARLRKVAQASANAVLVDARRRLQTQTHGTGATAAAITVVEDQANQQFVVQSPGVPHPRLSLHHMKRSGRTHTQRVSQNMVPIWLEYGTVKMPARPYMRPSADAEFPNYQREAEAAAIAAAQEVVG